MAAKIKIVKAAIEEWEVGAVAKYAVHVDGQPIGTVAKGFAHHDRFTRWGTRNRVHPSKRVVVWWHSERNGTFVTRAAAVDDLLQVFGFGDEHSSAGDDA